MIPNGVLDEKNYSKQPMFRFLHPATADIFVSIISISGESMYYKIWGQNTLEVSVSLSLWHQKKK